MRRLTVSVLSLFIVLPTMANTRLPVVNLAAGGVSARAAFGESVAAPAKTATNTTRVAGVNKAAATKSSKKRVVARPAVNKVASAADVGAKIVDASDVLTPRRPSADLWAHSDAPLRMPDVSEFSVMRSDSKLPEESIDAKTVRVASTTPVVEKKAQPAMSEIDAQIARLNQLQQRADESLRKTNAAAMAPVVAARKEIATPVSTPVKLSRMVVDMEEPVSDDVVMRHVAPRPQSARIASAREDMTSMSPSELRRAFRKTFLSENKHLSTFQIDDRFDVVSDMSTSTVGFTSQRNLSETGGIRPLEIKIKFRNDDAALSRDNYNLLTEYAGIILSDPTRAIQVSIPQNVTTDTDARKLAARRLAIVEQVLRDAGVSEYRIMPVLAARNEDAFVLRMISNDQYETLSQQKRNIFGDAVGKKKTYKSMSW